MSEKRRKRRWFQFSLRALLIFVLLASVGMSWLAVRRHRVRRQREAVEAIEKMGGSVCYRKPNPPVPPWLRELLGDDFFFLQVHAVNLGNTEVTDAGLEHLKGLTSLQSLDLGETQITDAGLEHLKGLSSLRRLDLTSTHVTEAGLEHLKGLTKLELLGLSGAQVTDALLEHLKGVTNLKVLDLSGTQVTPEEVKKLQEALPRFGIVY